MHSMTDTSRRVLPVSPTPRRRKSPGWLDLRLVTGVALVLVAVLVGASVLSSADRRQPVWSLSHDVAAGTVLTAADLRPVRVQLGSAVAGYLPITEAVAGKTVRHSLAGGQLLPRGELTVPQGGVTISVPVQAQNAPGIVRGDRITVWISTKTCRGVVLVSGVPVQSVNRADSAGFGSDSGSVLVLRVPSAQASRIVSALDLPGAVLRAGVLATDQQPADDSADLTGCAGAGT